jgi:hypothetical protein
MNTIVNQNAKAKCGLEYADLSSEKLAAYPTRILAIKMQWSNGYLINKQETWHYIVAFPTRNAILCGIARCLLTILVENEGIYREKC